MNSRIIIQKIEAAGWKLDRVKGSHHHFLHPTRSGLTTVPHPKKDVPKGTVRSTERQSGVDLS